MSQQAESKVPRFPIEAHHVKKGKMVMLKGKPCKIMDIKTSKTGKHGHMKVNITGIDVLTAKKYNDVLPGHANMTEFKLDKQEYQLLDYTNEGLQCLDSDDKECLFNIDHESEIAKKLKADFESGKTLIVTILKAPVEVAADKYTDNELVESYKEEKEKEGDS
jgi:translation initiation factor 5A